MDSFYAVGLDKTRILATFLWGRSTPQSIEIASSSTFPSGWLAGYLKSPKELRDCCCMIGSVPDFVVVVGTSAHK
jgi:hypothetical protein